jgi:hypothetical protein
VSDPFQAEGPKCSPVLAGGGRGVGGSAGKMEHGTIGGV